MQMAETHITQAKHRHDQGKAENARAAVPETKTPAGPVTLFDHLVSSNCGLPDNERCVERLTTEAQVILGAGTVTTARSMAYLAVHIMLNDRVRIRLSEELREPTAAAVKSQQAMPSHLALERLPYLRACVKEGLR